MNGEAFRLIVQTYICLMLAGSVITPQLLEAAGTFNAVKHGKPEVAFKL